MRCISVVGQIIEDFISLLSLGHDVTLNRFLGLNFLQFVMIRRRAGEVANDDGTQNDYLSTGVGCWCCSIYRKKITSRDDLGNRIIRMIIEELKNSVRTNDLLILLIGTL